MPYQSPTVTVTEKIPSQQYHERLKKKEKNKPFKEQYEEMVQSILLKKVKKDLEDKMKPDTSSIRNLNDSLIH